MHVRYRSPLRAAPPQTPGAVAAFRISQARRVIIDLSYVVTVEARPPSLPDGKIFEIARRATSP
jgi:hypothetical protein